MPATLYLVRTAPGVERDVERALAKAPGVVAAAVLFERHLAVRMDARTGDGAADLPKVAGVESAEAYPT